MDVADGEQVVPDLGAFCRVNHVEAEPVQEGPLNGLTFSVKDIFDVAGSRTGFGQPGWLESHPPAASTAPAVASLRGAGARLVGRTICDELTYSLTGENVHYGTPMNPRCPDRVPGGSSSGAGSAVAGGLCDVGLGSDCAGLDVAFRVVLRDLRHAPNAWAHTRRRRVSLRAEFRHRGMDGPAEPASSPHVRPHPARWHAHAGRPGSVTTIIVAPAMPSSWPAHPSSAACRLRCEAV